MTQHLTAKLLRKGKLPSASGGGRRGKLGFSSFRGWRKIGAHPEAVLYLLFLIPRKSGRHFPSEVCYSIVYYNNKMHCIYHLKLELCNIMLPFFYETITVNTQHKL